MGWPSLVLKPKQQHLWNREGGREGNCIPKQLVLLASILSPYIFTTWLLVQVWDLTTALELSHKNPGESVYYVTLRRVLFSVSTDLYCMVP